MLHAASLLLLAASITADEVPPSIAATADEATAGAVDPASVPPQTDEKPPPTDWTGAVALGATFSDGNTDSKRTSATVDATKTVEKSRYTLGFSYNRAEENDVETQDRTYGKGQYDHFLDEKSYLLGLVTAESDDQADLDLRWTAGAGYGYQFLNNDEWKLAGEAGLSYFSEEFENGDKDEYLAARLAWNADWKYSKLWQFTQAGQLFPNLEDKEDIYAQVDTRVKATLTETMFAQLQWVFSWDNTPAPDKERVDNLYVLTVGWTF